MLLRPNADHSYLLRSAAGAERGAAEKPAAAARAPAVTKTTAALTRAQSRAKESPGLALLAAGSIVWNLLGPLGGILVKVAQHPAANTSVSASWIGWGSAGRGACVGGEGQGPLLGHARWHARVQLC